MAGKKAPGNPLADEDVYCRVCNSNLYIPSIDGTVEPCPRCMAHIKPLRSARISTSEYCTLCGGAGTIGLHKGKLITCPACVGESLEPFRCPCCRGIHLKTECPLG